MRRKSAVSSHLRWTISLPRLFFLQFLFKYLGFVLKAGRAGPVSEAGPRHDDKKCCRTESDVSKDFLSWGVRKCVRVKIVRGE